MSCQELMDVVRKYQKYLDAPIRIKPKCHPKSSVDVHVDEKRRIVYLSCARCDRPVETIRLNELKKHKRRRGSKEA